MSDTRLAGIMIRSADPMRLAAWYAEVLDVTFDERLPEGCFGYLGELQFGILPTRVTSRPIQSRVALTYVVANFDDILRTLARFDVPYRTEQIEADQRIAYLRDPDANELAIVHTNSV